MLISVPSGSSTLQPGVQNMAQRDRRDFLKTAAGTGLGFWVAGLPAADDTKSPNEKVQFASIGIDGKGRGDTADAASAGNLVAICDVDDDRLGMAGVRYPKAKKYTDYRKMFDELGKE